MVHHGNGCSFGTFGIFARLYHPQSLCHKVLASEAKEAGSTDLQVVLLGEEKAAH